MIKITSRCLCAASDDPSQLYPVCTYIRRDQSSPLLSIQSLQAVALHCVVFSCIIEASRSARNFMFPNQHWVLSLRHVR